MRTLPFIRMLIAPFLASSLWAGTARAEEAASQKQNALVFVLMFVAALLLSTYVASKMIAKPKPQADERVIPVPLDFR